MQTRIVLITLIILIGIPQLLFASEPFEFVSLVIRSLQTCKIADDRIKSSQEDDIVPMMKNLIVFTNEIQQAEKMIEPYTGSKNQLIRESAGHLGSLYSMIVANNKKLLSFIEETLNNPGEAASKQGTWLRKLSENTAANDELWRMIPYAVVMSTYTLVNKERTEGGNLRFLIITRSERDRLRSSLRESFGEEIKKQLRGGILPIDASASLLWEFLSQDWKPADSK